MAKQRVGGVEPDPSELQTPDLIGRQRLVDLSSGRGLATALQGKADAQGSCVSVDGARKHFADHLRITGEAQFGGRDGAWAYANLGVLVALVIGFVGTLILDRSRVQAQEA